MTQPELNERGWMGPPMSLVYIGNSMSPTLKAPEIIYFVPYGKEEVRPGDVVVFRSPADGLSVTHRVISITGEGIRTRGDNNLEIDRWILTAEDIDGQVILARRNRRYRHISGGRKGGLVAALVRAPRLTWIIWRLYTKRLKVTRFSLRTDRKPLPGHASDRRDVSGDPERLPDSAYADGRGLAGRGK